MNLIPILLYHSISHRPPADIARFAVSPAAFREQMALVAASGCTSLTVSSLVDARERGSLPARPLVITFDDGWADTSDAVSVLLAGGLTATVYVTTGFVASSRSFLSWDELQSLVAAGIEVGSHSHTHPQLDLLQRPEAAAEIVRARELIADHLGHRPRSFAYPHGYHSGAVRNLVAAAGHDSACGVRNAFSHEHEHRFALSRLTVRPEIGPREFSNWLAGGGARVARSVERARGRAWRVCRRCTARGGGS